jgi:putative ABC transport system ATP-binding protein
MKRVVQLESVARDYRMGAEDVHAVRGVSLSVDAGEYVAVVGPSGCGKSTLLHLIGVVDQPTSGSVTVNGERVDRMSDADATRFRLRNIGSSTFSVAVRAGIR